MQASAKARLHPAFWKSAAALVCRLAEVLEPDQAAIASFVQAACDDVACSKLQVGGNRCSILKFKPCPNQQT